MLDELAEDLRQRRWHRAPARRVFIEKPGRAGELRPPSIPTVRDRVVQAATKLVIEPVFEADFLPYSFGFVRNARHTTRCRYSSTIPGTASVGWSGRTSPRVSRQSRMTS
jgi:retron-type reverse transcriptase